MYIIVKIGHFEESMLKFGVSGFNLLGPCELLSTHNASHPGKDLQNSISNGNQVHHG